MNWNYEHRTEKVRMQALSLNLRGFVKNTWIKGLETLEYRYLNIHALNVILMSLTCTTMYSL